MKAYDVEGHVGGYGDARTPLTGKQGAELHSWLEDESGYQPPNYNSATDTAQPADPVVARMMFYTRIINLGLSVAMIVASLLSLLTTTSATTGVIACYVTVFACLLCCFEAHIKQISKLIATNFGFLYSAKSRAIFMIFVGTLMFSFSLFGMLVGALLLVNAGFNFYLMFKYPGYDDIQRKDAQAELSEFFKAYPTLLAARVRATTDFVVSNPG